MGVPFLILHASMEAYLLAAACVVAASLVLAGISPAPPPEDPGYGSPAGWWWAPFASLAAVLVVLSTRRVPTSGDDVWVYLAWVRHLQGAERVALVEPYFGERTAPLSRVHVNGWLLEQAALVRVSGVDTVELVLRLLTPTLVAVALLGVYALARMLLRSERAGVLCASVYALFHLAFIEASTHNLAAELVARVAEDKHAARFLILPVALLCAVLWVRGRGRRYLGLFAFFCWTTVAVHPVVLPALGLCMLGFGVARVGLRPLDRRAWSGMAALAGAMWSVALGPMLLLLAGRSPAAVLYSADINGTPPEILDNLVFVQESWRHILVLPDGLYIMHPWLLLNPAIGASLIVGIPFLMRRARSSDAAQLLFGGLVAVVTAVYVPPVATAIGERVIVPGQLWRLSWPITPLAMITAGWMAWEGYAWARRRGVLAARLLPALLVPVLLAAVLVHSVAKGAELLRTREDARSAVYHPDPIFPWIARNVGEPSVVFAPDAANTALPAYTSAVNVVSLRGEGVIQDREALERSAGSPIRIPRGALDVHRFFHGAGAEERRRILDRYGADYLLLPSGSDLHEGVPGLRAVRGAPREGYALYGVEPGG